MRATIRKINTMSDRPLFIPVILGTTRKGRASENIARFVFSEVQKHEGVETELIDIRELKFPSDEAGNMKDRATHEKRMDKFLRELIWMSKVLRYGRESIAI